jgi:hypothetical protein
MDWEIAKKKLRQALEIENKYSVPTSVGPLYE